MFIYLFLAEFLLSLTKAFCRNIGLLLFFFLFLCSHMSSLFTPNVYFHSPPFSFYHFVKLSHDTLLCNSTTPPVSVCFEISLIIEVTEKTNPTNGCISHEKILLHESLCAHFTVSWFHIWVAYENFGGLVG